jgi:hypothetical protein
MLNKHSSERLGEYGRSIPLWARGGDPGLQGRPQPICGWQSIGWQPTLTQNYQDTITLSNVLASKYYIDRRFLMWWYRLNHSSLNAYVTTFTVTQHPTIPLGWLTAWINILLRTVQGIDGPCSGCLKSLKTVLKTEVLILRWHNLRRRWRLMHGKFPGKPHATGRFFLMSNCLRKSSYVNCNQRSAIDSC